MEDLVPIKVRIPLKGGGGKDAGHHKFPAFNTLPPGVRGGMDWSHYFDSMGIGWHYDKLSGHGERDRSVTVGDSHINDDPALWYGGTCVPEAFALAAAAAFPEDVEVLTEAEWEKFYDERSHVLEDDELHDLDELQKMAAIEAVEAKQGRSPNAAAQARRANKLDPDHPARGIRRNHNKTWALYKAKRGVTIHENHRKPV